MQDSSSGGNRPPRNRQSRSGGGNRNNRSGSRDGSRSGSRNERPRSGRSSEEESSRPPRGGARSGYRDHEPEIIRRSSVPKATGFQKFVKRITFGLVDLAPKKPDPKKPAPRESRPKSSENPEKRERKERREPVLVEPTTPRLYVGNLSYDATGDDLTSLFSEYGTVAEAAIVTQPGSSRSKGFAFVEMASVEEAKAAAAGLNDKDFQGRQMLVTGAKSEGRVGDSDRSGERNSRSGGRGEGRSGEGRSGEGRSGEGRSGEGRSGEGRSGEGRDRNERGAGRGERGERGRGGDRDFIEKPTRQVKPLEIEVVSSPSLHLINVNAEASEVDITDLFSGIGSIQNREETGQQLDGGLTKNMRIDLTDTGEAQKAVELLDGKFFMGHQIRVTGVKTEE